MITSPGGAGGLQVVSRVTNFSLVNASGTIPGSSYTTPNDGKPHPILVLLQIQVDTAPETGGAVAVNSITLGGLSFAPPILNAGSASTGGSQPLASSMFLVDPNFTVSLVQTAVSVGAARIWAQILSA